MVKVVDQFVELDILLVAEEVVVIMLVVVLVELVVVQMEQIHMDQVDQEILHLQVMLTLAVEVVV